MQDALLLLGLLLFVVSEPRDGVIVTSPTHHSCRTDEPD